LGEERRDKEKKEMIKAIIVGIVFGVFASLTYLLYYPHTAILRAAIP